MPLFSDLPRGERHLAYLLRAHRAGRPLTEILGDPYLQRDLDDRRLHALVARPEVVRSVVADTEATLARLRNGSHADDAAA